MSLMSGLGSKVSGKPKVTIAIIIVLTVIFAYFGSSFENEADPESFNPDHELIKASDEAGELFGTGEYRISVLVKADDHNLLEIEDMKALIEFEDAIRNDENISSAIVPAQNNPTGFASIADMLVMSYGLFQSRAEMDLMLSGFNQSLSGLVTLLQNTTVSNTTKAYALNATLVSLNKSLTAMQNSGNGMEFQFNKTISLAALDAIDIYRSPSNSVPSYLNSLKNYDVKNASTQTSMLIGSIHNTIDMLEPYLVLLNGTQIDSQAGAMILMGFDMSLPTLSAQAQTLDGTIVEMYYGAKATLTRDFGESDGTNAKGTIINMNFNTELDDEQRYSVERRVYDLVGELEGDLEYGVLGDQLINEEIQKTMDLSQMFLLMLVFVLIVLILFVTFRSGFDTVLTLLSLGMAITWCYGVSILLGIQGSIIATVVPILLVGLGVDYGIHMTMRFREEKGKDHRNKKAISIAIATVGMALLLATITTGIGFMSNTVSSLSILRDFAIMVTVGIVSSFIIMTTFLPAVKLVVSDWREDKGNKDRKTNSKVNRMKNNSKKHAVSIVTIGAKAGDRAPWAVLIILVIISGIAGYGASQLDTVFDFREFIPRDTDAYENYVYLIDEFEFGDLEYGEFYITGDVASPEVLIAMDQAISNTQNDRQVVPGIPSRSILSVMQKYANPASPIEANQSFIENWTMSDPDGDGIPNSNITTLFDILYDFEESSSEVMSVVHRNEDGEYDAALVQLRVTSDNLKKADVLVGELNDDVAPLKELEGGLLDKVYVIGMPVVINVVVTEMNAGQINSIIITVFASFIVLTFVFFFLERSFILGLITIIPVVLVILWILGTMIVFGYNLNVMTITIASLTVGMGITYSIHISERFTEDLKEFENIGEACENTLTHTGMALAGAFLTTAGGFGVLYFHKLPPLQQFGVIIALSITYSFLASAYVLPTFLILWAKWRKNYRMNRSVGEEEETAKVADEIEEQAEEGMKDEEREEEGSEAEEEVPEEETEEEPVEEEALEEPEEEPEKEE